MENPSLTKQDTRKKLRQIRSEISTERRQEASQKAFDQLLPLCLEKAVLSFASFQDEIDTWTLNEKLAEENLLILPRVVREELKLFRVTNLKEELKRSDWGILEPIPGTCLEVSPDNIEIALIPGLGFDPDLHRIGYGKGFYDRLIPKLTQGLTQAELVGVGFEEQRLESALPTSEHDQPLHRVLLG